MGWLALRLSMLRCLDTACSWDIAPASPVPLLPRRFAETFVISYVTRKTQNTEWGDSVSWR